MVANNTSVSDGKESMTRVKQAVYFRNDRWVEPWKENSFFVPLPCRRTSSVISEFLPLTPFRSRSAVPAPPTPPSPKASHHHPGMQRGNHVGVARFYDWSEEKEESVSISRLYREIAGGVSTSLPKPAAEKVRPRAPPAVVNSGSVPWPASNGRGWLNPGRMFLRDKGMLTKGEREIIEGIYRNRGDLRREGYKSEFYVRSHHDAWVVGKPGAQANKPSTEVPREPPRGGLMEVTAPPNQGGETPRGSGVGSGGGAGTNAASQAVHRNTCIMCMREQQLLQQLQQEKEQQQQKQNKPQPHNKTNARPADSHKHRGEGEGRTAPPSTPDRGLSPREGPPNAPTASVCPAKLLPRRPEANVTEIPPHSDGSLQDFSPSYESDSSDGESRGSSSKRKVHVKVVLPQVAPWSDLGQNDLDMPQNDHDLKTCMLQGRPALARERHLTHDDLKAKSKQKMTAVLHSEHRPRNFVQDDDDVGADEKKEEISSPRKCLLPTHHITLFAPDPNGGENQ